MKDYGIPIRQQFINNVSPFYPGENKFWYYKAWLLSLIFGIKMPHEKRKEVK